MSIYDNRTIMNPYSSSRIYDLDYAFMEIYFKRIISQCPKTKQHPVRYALNNFIAGVYDFSKIPKTCVLGASDKQLFMLFPIAIFILMIVCKNRQKHEKVTLMAPPRGSRRRKP